jgi:hypothetical protein
VRRNAEEMLSNSSPAAVFIQAPPCSCVISARLPCSRCLFSSSGIASPQHVSVTQENQRLYACIRLQSSYRRSRRSDCRSCSNYSTARATSAPPS